MPPTLDDTKTKRSFDLFEELKYISSASEELTIDDVGRLDEEKMMAHILDCVAALAEKQRVRVVLKKPLQLLNDGEALTADQQAARNKVFTAALALVAGGLTHDGAANDERCAALHQLLNAFPERSKLTDGRGWLPLHWAVVAAGGEQYRVTTADAVTAYELDPLALCRHHTASSLNEYEYDYHLVGFGVTPSHLLCILETTERTKALVRFFSMANPRSFTMNAKYLTYYDYGSVFGALHVACLFGQPSEWLLQQLLQLDSAACSRTPEMRWEQRAPLGLLCQYSSHVDERLMRCLLAANSSVEVVFDGVHGCLSSKLLTNRVALVTLLLEANPQAAQHKDEDGPTVAT